MMVEKEKELEERSIEECDAAVYREAYDEYVESEKKSRPIDVLWKELYL